MNKILIISQKMLLIVLTISLASIVDLEMYDGLKNSKILYFFSIIFVMVIIETLIKLFYQTELILSMNLLELFISIFTIYVSIRVFNYNKSNNDFYYIFSYLFDYYFVKKYIFGKNCNFRLIYGAICISLLIQTVIGILQLFGFLNSFHSYFNITGTFFNPAPFAGYIACTVPFLLVPYFIQKKYTTQICYYNIFFNKCFCVIEYT